MTPEQARLLLEHTEATKKYLALEVAPELRKISSLLERLAAKEGA